MRIALMQTEGRPGDVAGNLSLLEEAAARARDDGAELLIAPEMFLTGYNIGKQAADLAEPQDGPSAAYIADLARSNNLAIIHGYPERSGDRVYNAAQAIAADGSALANYRKSHLYGAEERRLFQAGDGAAATARIGDFTVGLLICYDVEFPEAVRLLALAGCDLIAVPTALMQPPNRIPDLLVPARACENQVFVAYANRCGAEGSLTYVGQSTVAGPDGAMLSQAGSGAALLLADLDRGRIAEVRNQYTYLNDRRPETYGGLQAAPPLARSA
ncbi:MAG: carbon-nitrogen hydrolase family protein [Minwuiales bacterium]|nr:carbon-nitrogen hydrolase family protein [Minwuiales bacterium]